MSESRRGNDRRARRTGDWRDAWQLGSQEFPPGNADPPLGLTRRDFVTLLGASVALGGLAACVREPDEKILPYVESPPDVLPGTARYYATAMTLDGFGTGLLVQSHEGRPTKVEGNPDHPASLGAAGVHEQASILGLYDPHRARRVRAGRRTSTWPAVVAAFAPASLTRRVGARGAGLAVVLPPTSSPLIAAQLDRVRARYPDARVYYHASLPTIEQLTAFRAALGAPLVPHYDFSRADVVVSLDADVFESGPFHLRYARDHADRRRTAPSPRLFVAEAAPTPTGTLADLRLPASPSGVASLAAALMREVERAGPANQFGDVGAGRSGHPLPEAWQRWVQVAASALAETRGRGIVVAGPRQPGQVHTVAAALNAALGNVGSTVWYAPSPLLAAGGPEHDTTTLARDLDRGVDTVVILEGNPCYTAPADLDFARRLRSVPNTLYLGAYDDETARVAGWHVPAAHYLESWGDTRAYDGTLSVVQPLIAPLFGGHTSAEILAVIAGTSTGAPTTAHDLLRQAWGSGPAGIRNDAAWADVLRRGVLRDSAYSHLTPPIAPNAGRAALVALEARPPQAANSIELAIRPSYGVHDGQFSDNPWLQELPDPITMLTWGNAALMAPSLATRLGVNTGDVVSVRVDKATIDIPVLAVPGHAPDAVTVSLGYGRSGAEAAARSLGADATRLRTVTAPYGTNASVAATGRHEDLALTQTHWTIEGREPEVLGVPNAAGASPTGATPRKRRPLTLYEPPPPSPNGFAADQWAMTIDLDVCTGCSACVVACQAENNIPVVGREGVLKSREMHWLRIDRYVEGPADAPRIDIQPMLCQHCEKAPCEYVCPVNATVHSDDGLNEMVYNRCVGTRFCSNNCPYKVRRFNWFDYNAEIAETERMAKNPDVTVRARGVMEKCTFCVQRVRNAQMAAQIAGEAHTGPVVTACQQSCPTQAIVFGSLTDPSSEVAKQFEDPRSFSVLAELGTIPRVRYLARKNGREGENDGSR